MTQGRIAEVHFVVTGYKHVIKYMLVPITEDILQDGFPVVKYDDTVCYLTQATNLQERTGSRTLNAQFNGKMDWNGSPTYLVTIQTPNSPRA